MFSALALALCLVCAGCMAALFPAAPPVVSFALSVAPAGTSAYKYSREERAGGTMLEDATLRAGIVADIMADDALSYMDVHTYCYKGRVFLLGEFERRSQVSRLVAIAKGQTGAVSVTGYLFPKGASLCDRPQDLYLAGKVRAALIGDGDVRSTNIDVEVVQCNAVLLGVVSGREEARGVEAAARRVEGVLSVKSYLFWE